jgi:hypothetical protein
MSNPPDNNSLLCLSYKQCKSLYLKKSLKLNLEDGQKLFQNWFFDDHHDLYRQQFNPKKPLVYEEKGCKYVNLFNGFEFQERPAEFSPEAMKGVKFIWEHIEKVLCSSNEEAYKYLKQWLCCSLSRKMFTMVILKALLTVNRYRPEDVPVKSCGGDSRSAMASHSFGSNYHGHSLGFRVQFSDSPRRSTQHPGIYSVGSDYGTSLHVHPAVG